MAKYIVTAPPLLEQIPMASKLILGLNLANCWPGPNKKPPFTPPEMRDQITSIVHHLPDHLLLVLFYVAHTLVAVIGEPEHHNEGSDD